MIKDNHEIYEKIKKTIFELDNKKEIINSSINLTKFQPQKEIKVSQNN